MLVVPYIPLRSIPVTLLPTLKNETIVNPIKTADTTKHLMSSLVFIFFICGVTILRRTMSICPVFLPLQLLLLKSLELHWQSLRPERDAKAELNRRSEVCVALASTGISRRVKWTGMRVTLSLLRFGRPACISEYLHPRSPVREAH